MPRLLIVHHTPSPAMDTMLRAVLDGTSADGLSAVHVQTSAALSTTATDVLTVDGLILGTPANLGSMSGALKHFFDTIYYPCLVETVGRPFGLYLHGTNDVDGALVDITKITTGLRWRLTQEPIRVSGPPTTDDLESCWEMGAAVAAGLMR